MNGLTIFFSPSNKINKFNRKRGIATQKLNETNEGKKNGNGEAMASANSSIDVSMHHLLMHAA